MLTLSQAQLQIVLTRFHGVLVNHDDLTEYQKFSLPFFSNRQHFSNPRVEVTSQIDITDVYKSYQLYYDKKPNENITTFTAYLKWTFIKAMYGTPFNWRYINHQWYQFNNLPLCASIRTSDNRSQTSLFLYDITANSWEEFYKKHAALRREQLAREDDSVDDDLRVAFYTLAYHIEGLHVPRMTSYRTTIKTVETHQPSIVFSDRYIADGRLYLPVHLSFSHASLIPKLAEEFLNKFVSIAQKKPDEVQDQYKLFLLPQYNTSTFSRSARL